MKETSIEKPQVTVIVPVYNVAPYIEECAVSLFNQTIKNIEYIFIDDASTDNSLEVLENVINKYPERKKLIRIIKHQTNKGVSYTRQEGVGLAQGEWIIHCDSDDTVSPEIYEKLLKNADTNIDVVICSYTLFGDDTPKIYKNQGFGDFSGREGISLLTGVRDETLHGGLCNKMIRRHLYEDIEFPENISFCEDLMVLLRLFIKHKEIVVRTLPDSLYNYRVRANSLVAQKTEKRKKELETLIYLLERIGEESEPEISREIDARIVITIYNLLILTNEPKTIFDNYRQYKNSAQTTKGLNPLKKIHLISVLKGYFLLSSLIGLINQMGKGGIKKLKRIYIK